MATEDTVTPYGWDWSQTTHRVGNGSDDSIKSLTAELVDALDGVHLLECGGLQGWEQGVEVFDVDGYSRGRVYYGGRDDVHVKATSAVADLSRPKVVSIGNAKTARVDTRVDTLRDFDELAAVMRESADMYGSLVTQWESDVRGVSRGRTLMVGAPSSALRVRLYEKWLESPNQYVEGTNRIEVQLRPNSKVKQAVSGWTPAETFCASRATHDLALRLGDMDAPRASLHVSRGTPDLEKKIEAMGNQYRRGVREWLDFSDGDTRPIMRALDLRSGEAAWISQ